MAPAQIDDRLFVALVKRVGFPSKGELRRCRESQLEWVRSGRALTLFAMARIEGLLDEGQAARFLDWADQVRTARRTTPERSEGPRLLPAEDDWEADARVFDETDLDVIPPDEEPSEVFVVRAQQEASKEEVSDPLAAALEAVESRIEGRLVRPRPRDPLEELVRIEEEETGQLPGWEEVSWQDPEPDLFSDAELESLLGAVPPPAPRRRRRSPSRRGAIGRWRRGA